MQQSIAMPLRHGIGAFAIAAALVCATRIAFAQEGGAPLPDSSYGESGDNYRSPNDLSMPATDDSNPDVVTIPIPGGGEVTVEGPDAPNDSPLPTTPGSQWGETQLTPYSHDIGPNGP